MRSKLYSYGSLFGIDWWRQSYGIGGYWLPRKLQFFCLAKIVVKCMSWTAKVSQWPINWFILKALIPINWLILKALLLIVVPVFSLYSVQKFREFYGLYRYKQACDLNRWEIDKYPVAWLPYRADREAKVDEPEGLCRVDHRTKWFRSVWADPMPVFSYWICSSSEI